MSGNKSVVMMASTDLAFGTEEDVRVQITSTPTGQVFISAIVGNEPGARLNVRISPEEWARVKSIVKGGTNAS